MAAAMLFPVYVVAAIVVTTSNVDAFNLTVTKELYVDFRLRTLQLDNDHIEDEISALERQLEQLGKPVSIEGANRIKYRIGRHEGRTCSEKNEVMCGPSGRQCVSRFLFCDGIKDCQNGYDEDDHVCSANIVSPGSSFNGVFVPRGCGISEKAAGTTVIVSAERTPSSGSLTLVHAFGSGTLHVGASKLPYVFTATSTGYFDHATRQLTLQLDPGQYATRGITVCTFENNDTAYCSSMVENSRQECSVGILHRVTPRKTLTGL
jgi:hypothetical protein